MHANAANKVAVMFAVLHDVFSIVEELAEKHDVVFVRASGAMCTLTAGVPDPQPKHAEALAHLAYDVFGFMEEMAKRRSEQPRPTLRICRTPFPL